MQLKRIRKSRKGRIEIIPMIDVMFFLLATFMLASLSMQQINAVPVNLPQGKSAQHENTDKKITISINRNGQILINRKLVNTENIKKEISTLLHSGFNDTVIIAADKMAMHGLVMSAMQESREAGAKHFSIIVENK